MLKKSKENNNNQYANTWFWLAIFMLGAASFSVFVLSGQSLRLDEAQSLWQTSHSTLGLLRTVASDVHVPLYHIILHYWELFFGNTVFAGRMLSLIFFLMTIPASYQLGKIAYGKKVGLFTALLVTISPFLNWYGSEIRMYSMLTFFTVVNQYFFVKLFKYWGSRWVWFGYGATAIAGALTHYFFLFALGAQAIFFLTHKRLFQKKAFINFLIIAFIVMILVGSWAYYVLKVGDYKFSEPDLAKPTIVNLFSTFSQFLFGFQSDKLNTLIVSIWPVSVLLAFLLLSRKTKLSSQTIYIFWSFCIPIFTAFIISIVFRPFYLSRYLILAVPSLYVFLSWAIYNYSQQASKLLRYGLVSGMLTASAIQIVSASTPVKENFRGAVTYIEDHASPQDVIVVSAPYTIYPVEYYYNGPISIDTLPTWNRLSFGPIPAFSENQLPKEVGDLSANHQTMWLLLSYNQPYEEDIRQYLDTHYMEIDKKEFSPGLDLYAYKLRYDVAPSRQINASLQ